MNGGDLKPRAPHRASARFVALVLAAALPASFSEAAPDKRDEAATVGSEGSSGIYRRVDEHGAVVFTDDPPANSGAEPVQLDPITVWNPAEVATDDPTRQARGDAADEALASGASYTVTITQPADGAAVRANGGQMTLNARIAPKLPQHYTLQLRIDGQPRGNPSRKGVFQLEDAERGSHQATVEAVHTESGSVLGRSGAITFHVLRHSRLTP